MTHVRSPAAAGVFYPVVPDQLAAQIAQLLANAAQRPLTLAPRMLIVPHAGYVYSGPVAAHAYAGVSADQFARVLLLGPSHFMHFAGLAVPRVEAFTTPLGDVAIDPLLLELAAPVANVLPEPHVREHSLEVQLPFLQVKMPGAPCLPVLTGDEDPSPAIELIGLVGARSDVLIVISSDLSHYLDYRAARLRDTATARAIVDLRPDAIGTLDACGRTALRAALAAAAQHGWSCDLLDLRSSGDTVGDRRRVVGYGAFALGSALDRAGSLTE